MRAALAMFRPRQSQNLTHWSVFLGRESPTTSRGLIRLHGQKNGPSVDVRWYDAAWPSSLFTGPIRRVGPRTIKTLDAIDVAAKYFVYKLYEATGRQPMQWATLHGLDELRTTIARAVERGWSFSRTWEASLWTVRPR